jgi:hypothetical protein
MRLLFVGIILFITACQPEKTDYQTAAANPEFYHRSVRQITEVIMHDIFSPPIASRIYTYVNVAGYEALVPGAPENQSLAGQLNGLEPLPQPVAGQEYCFPLASVEAMLAVGKALIFSEDKMEEFRQQLCGEMIQKGIPEEVVKRSSAYGQAVAQHILAWSAKDTYKESRSFPKYTITNDPSKWRPTPPDYMDAVEPSWNKIRCYVMDSCSQFKPERPTTYDLNKNSQFYKEVMEVYHAMDGSEAEKAERTEIANFWDCNPFTSNHAGHVMFATKKITPGGHWINITRIASTQAKADFLKTVEAYTLTSLALVDGFISCWDEKYRSQVVRPETVINEHIDPEWRPLLQTPPFPEYTSGHSVISGAAATALTAMFGDNFAFTDDTEEVFGLPARKFPSFFAAAEEAAISRMYGGIHYRPAIENGSKQGRRVGEWVVKEIKFKKGEGNQPKLTTTK